MKNKIAVVGIVLLTLAGYHGVRAVRTGDIPDSIQKTIPMLQSGVQGITEAATAAGNSIAELWGQTGTTTHVVIIVGVVLLALWNLVSGACMLSDMSAAVKEGKTKRMSMYRMFKDHSDERGFHVYDAGLIGASMPAIVSIAVGKTLIGNGIRLLNTEVKKSKQGKIERRLSRFRRLFHRWSGHSEKEWRGQRYILSIPKCGNCGQELQVSLPKESAKLTQFVRVSLCFSIPTACHLGLVKNNIPI